MARTEGATNKNKPVDDETIFLSDVLRDYTFWKKKIREYDDAGKDTKKVKLFAEVYKTALNEFTKEEEN
jgi:hypothetical protein